MGITSGTSRLDNDAAVRAQAAAARKRALAAARKRAAEAAAKRAQQLAAKRAAQAAQKQAQAHQKRLGTGRLMEMGNMPWEAKTAPGKGTGKVRQQSKTQRLEEGYNQVKSAVLDPIKQFRSYLSDAKKVYNAFGGKQLTGILDRSTGKVGKSFKFAGNVINKAEGAIKSATAKAGKVTGKIDNVTGFAKAAAGGTLEEWAAKTGAKAANAQAEKLIGKGAGKAGATLAAKTAGKAAGRFVPGANIAIAALDAKKAYDTLRDPKASNWKKGTAVATAAFSAVAATNIPIVSQAAAGLSVVSDLASNVNPKKVAEGAKKVASKAVDGAKDLGKKALKVISGW